MADKGNNMHPRAKNVGSKSGVKQASAPKANNQSKADRDPYVKGSRAPKGC